MNWLGFTLAYALCMASSHLLLKIASQHGLAKGSLVFIIANLIGFLGMLSLPFALQRGSTAITYSLAIGGGYLLLQIAAAVLFHHTLSTVEILGIILITVGLMLLVSKPISS